MEWTFPSWGEVSKGQGGLMPRIQVNLNKIDSFKIGSNL